MPLIEKSVGFKKAKKAGSAMLPAFFLPLTHLTRRAAWLNTSSQWLFRCNTIT